MKKSNLPDSAFVVLALLAEGEAYGYDIQRIAHNRGFQFWTSLKRSSIYNSLCALEEEGLVTSRRRAGEGPDRKVFALTNAGRHKFHSEALRHLSVPGHPKSEIDLGIYALPFLPKDKAGKAIKESIEHLQLRREFLEERHSWCKHRGLKLPALAFERPLRLLEAEISWLQSVRASHRKGELQGTAEWADYEFRQPTNEGESSDAESN